MKEIGWFLKRIKLKSGTGYTVLKPKQHCVVCLTFLQIYCIDLGT